MPRTTLGWWSFRFLLLFAGFFALFEVLVAMGLRGGETFFSNPALAIPIALAGAAGIAAYATGVISIVWRGERSPLVFLAVVVGLFVLVFVIGEFTSPH